MSGGPPQASPGAPQISFASPNVPRRTSYASVAAGNPASSQSPSVHLPPAPQQSVYTRVNPWNLPHTSASSSRQPPMSGEESTRIPETWGSGARESSAANSSAVGFKSGQTAYELFQAATEDDGFFKPTYLKGTRYMDDLEAAHKDSRRHKGEMSSQRPGHGSLSKSASNASLPKMQSSHRGISYEIIEREPPILELGPARLPSKWSQSDKYNWIEISGGGQEVRFVQNVKPQETEAPAARTDHPMPPQCGIYYYEVTILSKGKDGMIAVGFSSAKTCLERLPGWENDSFAYHGDDGKMFRCHITGHSFGPTFTTEDTIGCGVNFMDRTAFFTKNGNFVGTAFRELKETPLYPSVGMKRPHAHIVANFGQRPFVFDIDTYVERRKQEIEISVQAASITSLQPSLDRDDLCKALVAQYLSHDGYVETAQAFAQEVRQEAMTLKGTPESSIDDLLTLEDDQDAANRQQIRTAVLDGDMDKTLSLTNALFPNVLSTNHEINFRVHCRKFIEMIREAAELHETQAIVPPKQIQSSPNGHSAPPTEQAMDVDDPPTHENQHEQMEVVDSSGHSHSRNGGRPSSYDDLMVNQTIMYGRELNAQFSEHPDPKVRQLFNETMPELFGMFAYKDLKSSPCAPLLAMRERVKVAEALNSAILVSLGKSPSTALERIYKQSIVLIDLISEEGGPGSLINVRNILKSKQRPLPTSLDLSESR